MRQIEPDAAGPTCPTPPWSAGIRDWLAPHLLGLNRLAELERLDLTAILRGRLPWELAVRLDRELPSHLALPGGRAAMDYTAPVPVAAAKAQAFYGLTQTPRLADGRIPLRLSLLSPAGRPVAVTADLAGFWQGRVDGGAPGHARPLSQARLAGRSGFTGELTRAPKGLGRDNRIGSCSGQRSMVMAGLVPAICTTAGVA